MLSNKLKSKTFFVRVDDTNLR